VIKSQAVSLGQEVRLLPLALHDFAAKPLAFESVEGPLKILQLATGRNSEHEFHDYLRIKSLDGGSYWVPVEWVGSTDGLPIRRDPDGYNPRIPSATLCTWRNWLLGVRSPAELERFELRRKPKDLQAVVNSLACEQITALQQRFSQWDIQRDWLPLANSDESLTTSKTTELSALGAATASSAAGAPETAATLAVDANVNIPNNERSGWLPAEVCVFGRWIAGFWRHVSTGEWRSPHDTKPLIAPKEWKIVWVN